MKNKRLIRNINSKLPKFSRRKIIRYISMIRWFYRVKGRINIDNQWLDDTTDINSYEGYYKIKNRYDKRKK